MTAALHPAPTGLNDFFSATGVAVIEHAVSRIDIARMDAVFPNLRPRTAGARAADFTPQTRDWLMQHEGLAELATSLARIPMRLSRLQAFDKSPSANWFVPWHQDRAEDGRDRPCAELAGMVALRIHLDDCDENNGPLEAIPGSHNRGRLESRAIATLVAQQLPRLCLAVRGDIVAMRPLIVHRSQRARQPRTRRVLHLEYAPQRRLEK